MQLRSMFISGGARIDFSRSARVPYSKQEAENGFQSAARVRTLMENQYHNMIVSFV